MNLAVDITLGLFDRRDLPGRWVEGLLLTDSINQHDDPFAVIEVLIELIRDGAVEMRLATSDQPAAYRLVATRASGLLAMASQPERYGSFTLAVQSWLIEQHDRAVTDLRVLDAWLAEPSAA